MRVKQHESVFYLETGKSRVVYSPVWVSQRSDAHRLWFTECYCKLNNITPQFVDDFPAKFKWTVEIEVDEEVAVRDKSLGEFPEWLPNIFYAGLRHKGYRTNEFTVKIIDTPDPEDIERARGKS